MYISCRRIARAGQSSIFIFEHKTFNFQKILHILFGIKFVKQIKRSCLEYWDIRPYGATSMSYLAKSLDNHKDGIIAWFNNSEKTDLPWYDPFRSNVG